MIGGKAKGGERECGKGRVEDGLYLECGLEEWSLNGKPLESFLFDPPVTPPDTLRAIMTPLGMTLWEDGSGVHHVIDWVGKSHYPYLSDFVEEARVMGFSRRVPKTLDFSKLGPGSRMVFAHERAQIMNCAAYTAAVAQDWECPCGKGHTPGENCIGLHWRVSPSTAEAGRGRVLKSGTYPLGPLAADAPAPEYALGIFAALPITSLSLIGSQGGGYDKKAYEKASQSKLPVDVVAQ